MSKRFKIFAAFGNDVEEDVVRFGDFLCGLNQQCPDMEFSVFKSEQQLCEALEHPEERINSELAACEYFLLILGSLDADFALDKLNRAIEQYSKTHGNPDIHIFVNAGVAGADDAIGYFASDKYEHYVEQFKHNDTLKAKFLTWFAAKQKAFAYEVDNDAYGTPVIKVSGVPVSGLLDFDALLNNEEYQDVKKKLMRKRSERESVREEAMEADDADLWEEVDELTNEVNKLQDKISAMEKDTLALYQNYAKKTLETGYNSRLKRALEAIENGNLDRARRILDPEGAINNLKALENDTETLKARIEAHQKQAEQEINILFAEIDRLYLDQANLNRFNEIEKCYASIEHFQSSLGLDMTVLLPFAKFLETQNKHDESIEKYNMELARIRKLAEADSQYLPQLIDALNRLGRMHYHSGRNEQAMANYTEAWELNKEAPLAEHNARIMNNIANTQKDLGNIEDAETNYHNALDIYQELAKTEPQKYLPRVADVLCNIANLLVVDERGKEAVSYFNQSLEVGKEIIDSDPKAYLWEYADTFQKLAELHLYSANYDEAETNYAESLQIFRKLARDNPDAYLPNLASALSSYAEYQRMIEQSEQSEANQKETIKIYRRLAATYPDVYMKNLALAIFYLGILKSDTALYEEAEQYYAEAVEIYRKINDLPNVAVIFQYYAFMYNKMEDTEKAMEYYTAALEIFETAPDTYLSSKANAHYDLAELQFDAEDYRNAAENFMLFGEACGKLAKKDAEKFAPKAANALTKVAYTQALFDDTEESLADPEQAAVNLNSAVSNLQSAMGIYQMLEDVAGLSEVAIGLVLVGNMYKSLDFYDEAEDTIMLAMGVYESLPVDEIDSEDFARALFSLAEVKSETESYDEAVEIYGKSLAIYRTLEEHQSEMADALFSLANAQKELEDFTNAETTYREALAIYRALGDAAKVADALSAIAYTQVQLDQFEEAQASRREALEIYRNLEDEPNVAFALYMLGYIGDDTAQLREALAIYQRLVDEDECSAENVIFVLEALIDISTAAEAKELKALLKEYKKRV